MPTGFRALPVKVRSHQNAQFTLGEVLHEGGVRAHTAWRLAISANVATIH